MTKLMTAQKTTFAGDISFGVTVESAMGVSEFQNKLHALSILGGTVTVVLGNGEKIELDIVHTNSSNFTAFHEDGYEIHADDEVGAF
jgi:hypothetical protein